MACARISVQTINASYVADTRFWQRPNCTALELLLCSLGFPPPRLIVNRYDRVNIDGRHWSTCAQRSGGRNRHGRQIAVPYEPSKPARKHVTLPASTLAALTVKARAPLTLRLLAGNTVVART